MHGLRFYDVGGHLEKNWMIANMALKTDTDIERKWYFDQPNKCISVQLLNIFVFNWGNLSAISVAF